MWMSKYRLQASVAGAWSAVEAVGNEAVSWPDETRHLGLDSKAVLTVALWAGALLEQ